MQRFLTGIQSTGTPHLGNLLGAMRPALQLAQNSAHEKLFFIADLHALTTIKAPDQRREYTYATAAAWLACGLAPNETIFYRQSQIPAVCELAWYLSCFTPYPMLANAHAFKDKAAHLANVSAGLFTYPVLMAADILLYEATLVPVGKDQCQHLEMARDMVASFNHHYGDTFILPKAHIDEQACTIPGTDGRKMSKSYRNTIDPFLPEKALRKTIMAIPTSSTPLATPKDPAQCNVFQLYSTLAPRAQVATMRQKYLAGGYGYGQAKKELLGLILTQLAPERQQFLHYMQNTPLLEQYLAAGESQARAIAAQTLQKVRTKLGYTARLG